MIFGCGDLEDFKFKGFDIVVRVVVEFNDEKYYFYVVGVLYG